MTGRSLVYCHEVDEIRSGYFEVLANHDVDVDVDDDAGAGLVIGNEAIVQWHDKAREMEGSNSSTYRFVPYASHTI